ncbi:MAG: hypothetical protein ACOYIH_06140 [Candidatus Fimadaptatus sp.]|jgi:uncharacterized membrane protein YvlD (DUF360 family)
MKIDRRKLNRVALLLAIGSIIFNLICMMFPIKTYGVDSFLLSIVMFLLAYSFHGDERMRTFWIACLVMAILCIVSGVMNLVGALSAA